MKQTNDLTPKTWSALGFLEGLDGETKELCSKAFTDVTKYFFANTNKHSDTPVHVLVFPIIRKLIQDNKQIEINFNVLIPLIIEVYHKTKEETPEITGIDLERIVCLKVCTEYVNKKEE